MKKILCLGALCLALVACGSVPPAPTDHFYRLHPVAVAAPAPASPVPFRLLSFRGEGPFAERPIVFVEAAGARQLRQYHYHLWLSAPPQLVRDHLALSLATVLDPRGGGADADALEGRVLAFERQLSGNSSKAVVILELRLQSAAGQVRLARVYRGEQPVAGDSIDAFVEAMEGALAKIYAAFQGDLVALGRPG